MKILELFDILFNKVNFNSIRFKRSFAFIKILVLFIIRITSNIINNITSLIIKIT